MVSPNAKAQDTAVRSQLCQEVKAGATQMQILQKPENAAQACDPNLSQPRRNHRSVHLTRSVRRRAALFKTGSGKSAKRKASIHWEAYHAVLEDVETSREHLRSKTIQDHVLGHKK